MKIIRFISILVSILALLFSLDSNASLNGDQRFVLIIGHNQSLDKGVSPLNYADDDALRYYELFSLSTPNVALFTLLDDESAKLQPKLAKIAKAPRLDSILNQLSLWNKKISKLRQAGHEAELIFIYAGHGDIDKKGEGYINLLDKKLRRRDLFRKILKPSRANYIHLIIDACKSYFLVNKRGKWKKDQARSQVDLGRFLNQESLSSYPHVGVILATSGDESTHEWSRFRAGILSHELRSALAGAADINGDRKIEYSEVHGFIAAANARIQNAKAKLNIWARAPKVDRNRPLYALDALKKGRVLTLSSDISGRYSIEDQRGIRIVDLNKAQGLKVALAIHRDRSYYVAKNDQSQAKILKGSDNVDLGNLRFGKPPFKARSGSLDQSFRKHLYQQSFSLAFYRGFVAQTNHLEVSITIKDKSTNDKKIKERRKDKGRNNQFKKPTIGVLYFTYEGDDRKLKVLRKGLAEMLITDLSINKKLHIVERLRLETLKKELDLNQSRFIDSKYANRLGKLLGAKYLVWGSYFNLYGRFCLSAKVVEVERGLTFSGGKACGKEKQFMSLYNQVKREIEKTLYGKLRLNKKKEFIKRVTFKKSDVDELARALDLYDRGKSKKAKECIRRLLKKNPSFKEAKNLAAKLK